MSAPENQARAQCVHLLMRLHQWRALDPAKWDARSDRIRHAMGANTLSAIPETRLRDVRDALHALIMEVGA